MPRGVNPIPVFVPLLRVAALVTGGVLRAEKLTFVFKPRTTSALLEMLPSPSTSMPNCRPEALIRKVHIALPRTARSRADCTWLAISWAEAESR